MSEKNKNLLAEIRETILRGDFGAPGQRFLGIKALATKYSIGMDRAQRIYYALREEGILMLKQKNHYLSHGRIPSDSPLGKMRWERKTIALLSDHLESYYIPSFADSAVLHLQKEGFRILISIIQQNNYREVIEELYEMGVQGFLLLVNADFGVKIARDAKVPCVISGYECTAQGIDSVVSGGSKQAEHLADLMLKAGCKRFFFVTPRREVLEEKATYNAFFNRLSQKTDVNITDMVITDKEVRRNSKIFLQRLLEHKVKTGIVCTNEQLSQYVVRCCAENAISVPDEVMLAAFRTRSPMNQQNRSIITVEENIDIEAYECVSMLLKRIRGDDSPAKLITVEPMVLNRLHA